MIIKTVARRDSATALLRKLGVAQADYAKFITALVDGRFQVDVALAEASLKTEAQDPTVVTDVTPKNDAEDTPPKHGADPEDPPFEPATPSLAGDPFAGLRSVAKIPVKKPSKKSISVAPAKKAAKKASPSVKTPKVKAEKPAKAPRAAPPKKEPRVTMSSIARALILEGKTNAEVWAIIQPKYNLGDTKKYYPGWWRFELRRKGHTNI